MCCRNDGGRFDAQYQAGCRVLSILLLPLQFVCWLHHHSTKHAWLVVRSSSLHRQHHTGMQNRHAHKVAAHIGLNMHHVVRQ